MSERRVRVRFAPSPTGPLHIGGVRTALYNYLFAKKHGGDFILRIEDTDQTRFVPAAEQYIIDSLKWCGLEFDEGVGIGGPHAPYRQSERKPIYVQYADELIANGNAYYAFDTPAELDAIREKITAETKGVFQYDAKTRGELNNSLVLSKEETQAKLNAGDAYVIRFKMPLNETVLVNDIIRGEVSVNTAQLDDKVLFKSDGMPTYHLANIVDDHLMDISHVIRGEEWLPSAPLHVLLYKALGWEAPIFAHLPLILKPTGNGKLSKRDGDKMGFPVFPMAWKTVDGETYSGYREDGYFKAAFVNMLALLGWNDGTEQEIFSLEELTNLFSLERVGKSGAKFDPEKTKWFNQQYLRNISNEELAELYKPELSQKGISINDEKLATIISLVKERVNFVKELWDQTFFFFNAPTEYDAQMVKKRWKEDTGALLNEVVDILKALGSWDATTIHDAIALFIEQKGIGMGAVMTALRLSIVGSGMGPDLCTILELIGKEETIARVSKAVSEIKV